MMHGFAVFLDFEFLKPFVCVMVHIHMSFLTKVRCISIATRNRPFEICALMFDFWQNLRSLKRPLISTSLR